MNKGLSWDTILVRAGGAAYGCRLCVGWHFRGSRLQDIAFSSSTSSGLGFYLLASPWLT